MDEEHVRAWYAWLDEALWSLGFSPDAVGELIESVYRDGRGERWKRGDYTATPELIVIIATGVGRDPEQALRAAGYEEFAAVVRTIIRHARKTSGGRLPDAPRVRYVGGMEPHEPESYEPTIDGVLAAIAGLGERMDRRFGAVYEQIDHANADIEVLTTQGREHTARFAGLREEIRGDILAAEARTAARLDDLRQVMLGAKADIARHADDPEAHQEHRPAA